MSIFVAHVDGGSHGNPGPSGIGVVMQPADGEKIRISKWIGHQDNNVAEYVALLEALQHALVLNAKTLRVFSDSEVVVRQMTGWGGDDDQGVKMSGFGMDMGMHLVTTVAEILFGDFRALEYKWL